MDPAVGCPVSRDHVPWGAIRLEMSGQFNLRSRKAQVSKAQSGIPITHMY